MNATLVSEIRRDLAHPGQSLPHGEEAGANVLRVNDTLIVGAGFPRLRELLDGYGATVVPLQNTQIARIDAGFTCMSLRW